MPIRVSLLGAAVAAWVLAWFFQLASGAVSAMGLTVSLALVCVVPKLIWLATVKWPNQQKARAALKQHMDAHASKY